MKWYEQVKVGDVFLYRDGTKFYGVILEVTRGTLSWQWYHKEGVKANRVDGHRIDWAVDTLDRCVPASSLFKELM
jgi:hypothetical protein